MSKSIDMKVHKQVHRDTASYLDPAKLSFYIYFLKYSNSYSSLTVYALCIMVHIIVLSIELLSHNTLFLFIHNES